MLLFIAQITLSLIDLYRTLIYRSCLKRYRSKYPVNFYELNCDNSHTSIYLRNSSFRVIFLLRLTSALHHTRINRILVDKVIFRSNVGYTMI